MISEVSLLKLITSQVRKPQKDVIVGIGDDAAVIKVAKNRLVLATCDALVEGVHFLSESVTPQQLGWKIVAVNVSDIAAMGGIPKHLLVSLVIPKNTSERFVEQLYNGILRACKKYDVDVVGGNMSRGEKIVIDGMLIGEIDQKQLITRAGAHVGDVVLVTGTLGDASVVPTPRIKEARLLAESGVVTSMIDVSDGLGTDLLRICEASHVGVRLHWQRGLEGGEDYELCFTTALKHAEEIRAEITRKTGTKVSIIGEILPRKQGKWLVLEKGREIPLVRKGWDHFA